MASPEMTQGDRIRELFRNAEGRVEIIAPFIKTEALKSLLEVVPFEIHLRCVTRWLPREIASGVSDPEILNVLEERGNFTLTLVDNLHAKIYIADENCLAGSSNVTLSGLGEAIGEANIEILVTTTIHDPGVASTLAGVAEVERPATHLQAEAARRLADSFLSVPDSNVSELFWFPRSRLPERAYRFYSRPPDGYIVEADKLLLHDLAGSNLHPGYDEDEFHREIRSLLAAIPLAAAILNANEDTILTLSEALPHIESLAVDGYTSGDLWVAFVNWMVHFYPDHVMKQEIAEVALRRARLLR